MKKIVKLKSEATGWFMRAYRPLRPIIAPVAEVLSGFWRHNGPIHAAGLTYFSMLALVPILCVLLFAAKTCHVDRYARAEIDSQIETFITRIERGQEDDMAVLASRSEEERAIKRQAAADFGRQARDVADKLFDRIERFDIGTLGWIGFMLLLCTLISSLGMVELSFNEIFGVSKPRPYWRRAVMYLSILIVLPVLLALAASLPVLALVQDVLAATAGAGTFARWTSEGLVWVLDSWPVRNGFAFAMASFALACFYKVMPNCPVGFRSAFRGGALTVLLFALWLRVCAVVQVGIANSSALYGSFALLPILLAWMYMSWQIVLLGANIVFAFDRRRVAPSA